MKIAADLCFLEMKLENVVKESTGSEHKETRQMYHVDVVGRCRRRKLVENSC